MRISKKILIGLVTGALCVAALTGTALAYFSDKTVAMGEHPVKLGYSTEINEEIVDGNKQISIANTGETEVTVRVQLFYSNADDVTVTVSGNGWAQQEEAESDAHVWYYNQVLAPGATTGDLEAKISADAEKVPAGFDVIVVSQSSPVAYDEAGNPYGYYWTDASANE